MTDPTGRPADADPVTPDPGQAAPDAPDGWAAGTTEPETEPETELVPEPPPVASDEPPLPPDAVDARVPEADSEPAVASSATPERQRRRLLAACALLFALSLALAVLAAVLASRLESERDRRDKVEEVAGRFATALLTYDHTTLDQAKERVLSLSTGKFRQEYERAFSNGLDTLIKETKATSSGTVTDVFVGPVEDDTASAIVVANAVSEGTTGTRRTVASYIQLELVRVGGQWRVDGVTNLNFGQGTTPTTAPK